MNLYITYTKNSFTNEQIRNLQQVGEVIFLEKIFELDKAPYFEDNDEKILVVDPDWYNWYINANHLSKVKNRVEREYRKSCVNKSFRDKI